MRNWIAVAALACAAAAVVGVAGAGNQNYNAHLVGDNEVPPRETQGQGQASIKVSKDGLSLECKLIASNIDNVVQAHIHVGPAGANGPQRQEMLQALGVLVARARGDAAAGAAGDAAMPAVPVAVMAA